MGVRALLVAGLVTAIAVLAPATADAKLTAKVSVTESGGTRLVVALSSPRALPARLRATQVRVRAGRTTFTLMRPRGARTAVAVGTWRTGVLSGARRTAARAAKGTLVTVLVRTRAGRQTLTSRVAGSAPPAATPTPAPTPAPAPAPAPAAPTPPPTAQPPFAAPGRELTGQEAVQSFGQYFFNGEFSDCAAGNWPACTVENRYDHGQDGTFIYRRCTPTSGSDINFVDAYVIVGAVQHADGSWVVEYTTSGGDGFYHWEVGQDRAVNGYYSYKGGAPELLQGYLWRQPATFSGCV